MLTRADGTRGDLTQITSPNGKWIKLTYDDAHRVTPVRDNIGRTVGYTYKDGRPHTTLGRAGRTTTIDYDLLNRPTTISYGTGETTLTEHRHKSRIHRRSWRHGGLPHAPAREAHDLSVVGWHIR